MNIVMECEATLSKKLEKICEEGDEIILHVTSVRGNKGRGLMRMSLKEGVKTEEVSCIGETSLMLKILKVEEDVPDFPANPAETGVVSFFEARSLNQGGKPESLVASYVSPEVKEGKSWQGQQPKPPQNEIARREEVKQKLVRKDSPSEKSTEPSPKSIMSYDELQSALAEVKDIDKEIPIPQGKNLSRQDAIRVEMSIPRISKRCYIGNCLKSTLAINDIALSENQCVSLAPGQVIDISRLPAKKVRDSADLEWCIRNRKVEFKTHEQYLEAFESMARALEGSGRGSLQIFDKAAEAKAALTNTKDSSQESILLPSDVSDMEVDNNTQVAYEDDRDMDRLVSSMPK